MLYLDSATTAYPKAPPIYTEMMVSYRRFGVTSVRGKSALAHEMGKTEEALRRQMIMLLGAGAGAVTVLSPSATIAMNQVLFGLDLTRIRTIYISPFDHNASWRPLVEIQKRYTVKICFLPFRDCFWDESETLKAFQKDKPDAVVCTHGSNVFGNLLPVENIFSLAKSYGAVTVMDTAQTAGCESINMEKMSVDFAVFAGHKHLYGPSGIGGFVMRGCVPQLRPFLFGGTGVKSEEEMMPDGYPEHFEAGSPNGLGVIGLHLALKWLCEIGSEAIRTHRDMVFAGLLDLLREFPDQVRLLYPETARGTLSIRLNNFSIAESTDFFEHHDIAVRCGLHCSPLAHRHLNTFNDGGTIRLSIGFLTQLSDLQRLRDVLLTLKQ